MIVKSLKVRNTHYGIIKEHSPRYYNVMCFFGLADKKSDFLLNNYNFLYTVK